MCCNPENKQATPSCSSEEVKTPCCSDTPAASSCCDQSAPKTCCPGADSADNTDKFCSSRMIPECLEYARQAKAEGRPIIGIMCEYAPRELINAIDGVAVCLCGGSQATVETAEVELSPGICPIIKSTYGYFLEKSNPFLEMADLLVAETTCDGKKKVFELMGKDTPTYSLELPQRSDTPQARESWENQCRDFARFLESRFNTTITSDSLEKAIKELNIERRQKTALAELMTRDAPPLSGCDLLGYNSIISPLPWNSARLADALNALPSTSECAGIQGRKRVLLTGVPLVHGAERVISLIEDNGGLVVAQENCTGLKPLTPLVEEGTADPIKAIAEKYLTLPCSVMSPNTGRETLLTEMIKKYKPDCIIDLSWQGCHTYDIESSSVKNIATGSSLPILKIQTDYSDSDSQALITRIQALFEIS